MTQATAMIEAEGLTLGYRRHRVFDDASFSMSAGRVGLLGPNGAGKSTLMEAVVALRRPSAGRLVVLGHDVSTAEGRSALRRETGYLPQSAAYDPRFTVGEHVSYCGWLKGLTGDVLDRATREAVEAVNLSGRADVRLKTLSGGMVRRATIAGAMVASPRLLVLDEPSVGLDPEQRVTLRELLTSLTERTSVLLSTHLVEDLTTTCESVVVLDEGQARFSGSIAELAGRPVDMTASCIEAGYIEVLGGRTNRAAS